MRAGLVVLVVGLLVSPAIAPAVAPAAASLHDRPAPDLGAHDRHAPDHGVHGRPAPDHGGLSRPAPDIGTNDHTGADREMYGRPTPGGGPADRPTVTRKSLGETSGPPVTAAILSVYPNPPEDEDAGEFVAVTVPAGNWTVTDGERTVSVPGTGPRTVAMTPDPALVRPLTTYPVREIAGLSLANSGETIALQRDGTVVARATYANAPEGQRYVPGVGFEPIGASDFAVTETSDASVTAFALPDAPEPPLAAVRNATRRLYLAGYTFTSRRIADALVAAAARGVDVRVLLEGGPVGGITDTQAQLLDRLDRSGVSVRVVAGEYARYDYHHAKYLVADDRAVVLSENWKPAGVGGNGSRGWGTIVEDPDVATELATVFRADATWIGAQPWRSFRQGRTFEPGRPANATFPRRTAPRQFRAESVRVLVAPDNAERALVDLVESASDRVYVQQVRIASPHHPLLRAVLAAARRGVQVRVQLSSAWYVREENARLVEWLRDRARRDDLSLSAKLADPGGRFEKVHNKGVVVDGEHVVVGSINWNNHSLRANREVALVVSGPSVGDYYASVFEADWRTSGDRPLPVGVAGAVAVGALLAGWYGRRIEFETAEPPAYPVTDGEQRR